MNHKKLSLIAIPLFILLAYIIYITKTFNSFGVFLFDFSISFLVIFAFIYFVRKETFNAWFKFASFYLIISIALVLSMPAISSDPFFPIEKKVVTLFSASIFAIVSLIIMIFKSLQLRKEKK